MSSYGEDGSVGFHIVGSIIAYALLVFIIFKLIGLFLLLNCNESQKPLRREQLKFVTEKILVATGLALVLGAILFFAIFFGLILISGNLFDINSVIYSVLDRQFFILALLMASVNSVLIFYIFFNGDSHNNLKQFLELREETKSSKSKN